MNRLFSPPCIKGFITSSSLFNSGYLLFTGSIRIPACESIAFSAWVFWLHRGCDRVFGRIGFRILPAIQLIRDTVAVFAPFRIQCFVSGCSFFNCLDPCPIAAVTVPALKGIALTAWIFQRYSWIDCKCRWIGLCIFTTVQLIGDAVGSGAPLRIQCQISCSFLDVGYLVLIFTVAVPALEGIPLTAWVLQGNGGSYRICWKADTI